MRVVIQRVSKAEVKVEESVTGSIDQGLLVYAGIEEEDGSEDIEWLSNKIANMRIFDDEEGKMNHSVKDVNGECLVVSQFTLHALTKKGNRPSFIKAANPDIAVPVYERFIRHLGVQMGKPVQTGEFGANMQVESVNDGPVTILIDTKNRE